MFCWLSLPKTNDMESFDYELHGHLTAIERVDEDYKSDRYESLEKLLKYAEQRRVDIKEWFKKVNTMGRFYSEYEHDLDINWRAITRIESSMDEEKANY